ncbi:sigma 54-interacting transcriptional regulator [Hoeflea sp. AS60]|uniref:sigma 54-interacting transcriptional regulator n=1 Tax=Hoeflea sp. AS60 TaxID=3135780 RepID=UPI0031790F62
MENSNPTLLGHVHSSILPCIALDTHSGVIVTANSSACQLLDDDELPGKDFAILLAGGLPELIVFTEKVDYYKTAWTRDLTLVSSIGRQIDTEIHGVIINRDASTYLVMQIIDMDAYDTRSQNVSTHNLHAKGLMEWNRARDFFREMENENRLILDAAGEGIYGINLEGKTTFVNNAAQEMLGWTQEDLLGEDIHAMIHHHHLDGRKYPSRECPIYHSFRNEQVNRVEDEVFWHKNSRPIQVEYTSTPIYDQQVLAGAVVIFRDVSERRENERKLRAAMDQIEALRERLEQENEYLQEEIRNVRSHYDLAGSSPAILRTLAQIELVSKTQSNVLISGEGGTGKSLIASAIHKSSSRAKRPIIRINCAGIPPSSFESELYGHVRGAFQGAVHDRTGKLEIANGGTLYLDEVSEIPIELQGKILKTLQEQSLERLGDNRISKINVRVIASSSKDLTACIKNGTLRQDLYFHLNVFPIECQPLRERLSDIPELTQHFLTLACERLNLQKPTITKANIRQLQDYHWPGNVRELQNVVERGAILSRGEKLILDLQKSSGRSNAAKHADILTEQQMNDLQASNIIACLKRTGGRVSGEDGAAQLLGIKPTTLYSRIKKLGIVVDDMD